VTGVKLILAPVDHPWQEDLFLPPSACGKIRPHRGGWWTTRAHKKHEACR